MNHHETIRRALATKSTKIPHMEDLTPVPSSDTMQELKEGLRDAEHHLINRVNMGKALNITL
jgi:hypothetical protein